MALFMPIIIIFFQENGLDFKEAMLIIATASITTAIIEIPSGYFADVFGRKTSLVCGTIFSFIGITIYAFSHHLFHFLPGALCLGIGQSFISGSDTALMYDSLAEMKREKEFVKYEGRSISLGNFVEAFASIIGGFLAGISLRTPFYYQMGIAFFGILAALLLVEPKIHNKILDAQNHFKRIISIIQYALIKNTPLRWNILYSSILGLATLTMAWVTQPYYKSLNIDIKYFGVISAILNLAVALTAFHAYKIEKRLNTKIILISFLLLISFGFFFTGYYLSLWSLGILLIFYLVRGIATPVLRDYVNRVTPPEMRATVMSVRSLIIRCLFAPIAPFLGYITDIYSIQTAFLFSAILFFTLGSIVLFFLLKNNTN